MPIEKKTAKDTPAANKRVNFGAMVGDMAANKGERITDAQSQKLLNTEQVITVSLSKIHVSAQIRMQIHQDKVDEIAQTYPLRNYPEIRKVDPAIDGSEVPEGYEYVLLTGEHRFRALEQLKIQEHNFKFVPPSQLKTKADVIKYQYAENNIRADMHIIEKAKALKDYMLASGCNQGEAGKALNISTTLASRLQRISKYLSDTDNTTILDLNIKSERVVVGITKLIEIGITNWPALITDYVTAEHGKFDPELIYESTLNQIVKDLTNKEQVKAEDQVSISNTPEIPASSNLDNFKSSSEGSDKAPNNDENQGATKADQEHDNVLGIKDEQSKASSPEDLASLKNATHVANGQGTPDTATTPPSTPLLSPDEIKKRANVKIAVGILQKVMDGKTVADILKDFGPEIKNYITVEDGEKIYETVQNLSFEN